MIKQRLRDGKLVRVMSIGALPSPKLVEMAGLTGDYHGIWIDQEHALCHSRANGIDVARVSSDRSRCVRARTSDRLCNHYAADGNRL